MISVLNNLAALMTRRHLTSARNAEHKAMERLASGTRLNHVYDDAAGFALSSHLDGKLRSLQQAQRNAFDAVSMMQVAEGGLSEIDNLLLRIRELAVQAASDTVGDEERELLNIEVVELRDEVERMAQSTRYLGTNLLNGSEKEFEFQIGVENTEYDRLRYSAGSIDVTAGALGVESLDITDSDSALSALETIDEAVHRLQIPRATLGALQARIHSMTNFLSLYEENITGALGRIRDTDYVTETANLVKARVQSQAAIAVLTQANQIPQTLLKLLDKNS